MRKNEVIEINGKRFVIMVNKPAEELAHMTRWEYRNIWEAYDRPSRTKEEIWEDWKNWFNSFDNSALWVQSRNTNQFTIAGYININDKVYNVYITKCRQELYPVI